MTDLVGAGKKAVVEYLKSGVDKLDIKPELKKLVNFIIDNSDAYADFFIEYAKHSKGDLDPKKLLIDLLKSKGKTLADFGIQTIDNETMNNCWAVIKFAWDLKDDAKYASPTFVGVFLTLALVVDSGMNFLLEFTPAQVWWYEHMLKDSSPRYVPHTLKTTLITNLRT